MLPLKCCFSFRVSDKTCFCFLGSDFNLFVGLYKVFQMSEIHSRQREGLEDIPQDKVWPWQYPAGSWPRHLSPNARLLPSASVEKEKHLWSRISRWNSLKSEEEEKGTKCYKKKSTGEFLGSILFRLLTVVRATLSSERSQHRKCITETAQKSDQLDLIA